MKNLLSLLFLACLVACGGPENTEEKQPENQATPVKPKYARYFEISGEKSNRTLRIFNPWKKGELIQEIKLAGGGLKIPVKSIVPMSTSFYGYIDKLGELETITAIEDRNFVYHSALLEKLKSGKLQEIGQSETISVERTIVLHPDLVMISGKELLGPNLQKIQQSGITVLNNMDWQEEHPLGKAEWIKVFGLLYNKEAEADSIFNDIERKYLALAASVKQQVPAKKTDVLLGYNYQGTWFLPGGKSYVAQYLRDGGAAYKYDADTSTGSLKLNAELVFNDFSATSVWLHPGFIKSKKELLEMDERYARLAAFKNSRVYNNTARSLPEGGNDFWESSPVNPDVVLADLIKILYPQLLPDHKLYFYRQLE